MAEDPDWFTSAAIETAKKIADRGGSRKPYPGPGAPVKVNVAPRPAEAAAAASAFAAVASGKAPMKSTGGSVSGNTKVYLPNFGYVEAEKIERLLRDAERRPNRNEPPKAGAAERGLDDIITAIRSSDDPFREGGAWMTTVTRAISAVIAESEDQ